MNDINLDDLLDPDEESVSEPIQNDDESDTVFKLKNSTFDLALKVNSFVSEKDMDKFIKCVERMVRMSQEYKLWVRYITENLGVTTCALTNERMNECSVDIHHHPISLYTVVKSVISKDMTKDKSFSTFDIATKVIELHFNNKIGYVPLLSDLHAKYHNGFLNIPIEMVSGDYKYIMLNYNIDENEYDKISRLCNVHKEDVQLNWGKDNYPGIYEENVKIDSSDKQLSE